MAEIKLERGAYFRFTPMPTRWGDADALGHINNVKFVQYIESGRLDYFEQLCGITLEAGMSQGFIIASLQAEFHSQVHHPETLEVATRISRIGNSSFDVDACIFATNIDKPVFSSRGVCVWFDFEKNSSQSVPDDIRQKIITFEQGSLS